MTRTESHWEHNGTEWVPIARYHGVIDVNVTGQPFVDGNEVWAHIGWVDPDNGDVYSLNIPAENRDRINELRALYISLGTRHGRESTIGQEHHEHTTKGAA